MPASRAQYFGEVVPAASEVREGGFTPLERGLDRHHFYKTQKLPTQNLSDVMDQLS